MRGYDEGMIEDCCVSQSTVLEEVTLQHLGEADRALQVVEESHIESPVKALILLYESS